MLVVREKNIRYIEIMFVASCFKNDNLKLARVAVHYCQGTGGMDQEIAKEF